MHSSKIINTECQGISAYSTCSCAEIENTHSIEITMDDFEWFPFVAADGGSICAVYMELLICDNWNPKSDIKICKEMLCKSKLILDFHLIGLWTGFSLLSKVESNNLDAD